MPRSATPKKYQALLLLAGGLCFFIAGIVVLTFGALKHVNPEITFAGLFRLEPLINLVYTILL